MAQNSAVANQARSVQVLTRFGLRIVVLSAFAILGGAGFSKSFPALLWMSTIFCAVVALLRREAIFDNALTNWDEGAAYGVLYCLMLGVNH